MSDTETMSVDFPEHNPEVRDYEQLQAEYESNRQEASLHDEGYLLNFIDLPEGKDAYNPSGPFVFAAETYVWARVESREAQDAVAMLFKQTGKGVYSLVEGVPVLPIEDPFTAYVGNLLVVGGVAIEKDEHERVIGYRTVFYKGESLKELHLFAKGPAGMKDIRFAEIGSEQDSKILVFTRPYIPVLGRLMGRVAVTTISSLEELNEKRLAVELTEILPGMFAHTEWGGVNDVYIFPNGLVGVLCHIAKFDEEGKRHYAAAVFVFDPERNESSPLRMIAERKDFPMGAVKIMPENLDKPEMHDDLADVVFSSRLVATEGDVYSSPLLELTCGLSDAAAGTITITNPFPGVIEKYFSHSH